MKKTAAAATSRASDKFILRLPDGMREHLAEVAEREGRSMNAVAVAALAMYFEHASRPRWPVAAESKGYRVDTAIKDLVDQMANQHQELVELIRKADPGELVQLIKQKIK
jgi:predicted transcriptional regulator